MQVAVDGQLVAHGVQAGAGDDHGLGLAADLMGDLWREVLDHDRDLLRRWRGRVSSTKDLQQVGGLVLVVARVVLDLLEQAPVGLVGGVVLRARRG